MWGLGLGWSLEDKNHCLLKFPIKHGNPMCVMTVPPRHFRKLHLVMCQFILYTHTCTYVDCNMEFSQLCSSLKSSGLWNEELLAWWVLVHTHCHKMTVCVCVYVLVSLWCWEGGAVTCDSRQGCHGHRWHQGTQSSGHVYQLLTCGAREVPLPQGGRDFDFIYIFNDVFLVF